jgi:hypothetical protein
VVTQDPTRTLHEVGQLVLWHLIPMSALSVMDQRELLTWGKPRGQAMTPTSASSTSRNRRELPVRSVACRSRALKQTPTRPWLPATDQPVSGAHVGRPWQAQPWPDCVRQNCPLLKYLAGYLGQSGSMRPCTPTAQWQFRHLPRRHAGRIRAGERAEVSTGFSTRCSHDPDRTTTRLRCRIWW